MGYQPENKDILIEPRVGVCLRRTESHADNLLLDALKGKEVEVLRVDTTTKTVYISAFDKGDVLEGLEFAPTRIPMSFIFLNRELFEPVITQ